MNPDLTWSINAGRIDPIGHTRPVIASLTTERGITRTVILSRTIPTSITRTGIRSLTSLIDTPTRGPIRLIDITNRGTVTVSDAAGSVSEFACDSLESRVLTLLDRVRIFERTGMWRNWQTRRSQKPVMVTSWRFKSSHPHHVLGELAGARPFA